MLLFSFSLFSVFNLHPFIHLRSDVAIAANFNHKSFLFQRQLTTHQRFNRASQTVSAQKLCRSCCFSIVLISLTQPAIFTSLWELLTRCCLVQPVRCWKHALKLFSALQMIFSFLLIFLSSVPPHFLHNYLSPIFSLMYPWGLAGPCQGRKSNLAVSPLYVS